MLLKASQHDKTHNLCNNNKPNRGGPVIYYYNGPVVMAVKDHPDAREDIRGWLRVGSTYSLLEGKAAIYFDLALKDN